MAFLVFTGASRDFEMWMDPMVDGNSHLAVVVVVFRKWPGRYDPLWELRGTKANLKRFVSRGSISRDKIRQISIIPGFVPVRSQYLQVIERHFSWLLRAASSQFALVFLFSLMIRVCSSITWSPRSFWESFWSKGQAPWLKAKSWRRVFALSPAWKNPPRRQGRQRPWEKRSCLSFNRTVGDGVKVKSFSSPGTSLLPPYMAARRTDTWNKTNHYDPQIKPIIVGVTTVPLYPSILYCIVVDLCDTSSPTGN